MERQQVVDEIVLELIQLKEEENLEELIREKNIEQLYRLARSISVNIDEGEYLNITLDEIPEDCCLAMAFLAMSSGINDTYIFDDWLEFAYRLGKEAGEIGKSIAAQMQAYNLSELKIDEFVDESFADEYDSIDWEEDDDDVDVDVDD